MSSRFSERVFPFHNFIQNKFYAKSYTPFDSAYMETPGGKIRGLEMARKVVFGNSPIATIVAIFKNFWNSKIATKCRRRHARHEFVSIVNRRLWRHFGADFVTISSQFSSQIRRRCKHAIVTKRVGADISSQFRRLCKRCITVIWYLLLIIWTFEQYQLYRLRLYYCISPSPLRLTHTTTLRTTNNQYSLLYCVCKHGQGLEFLTKIFTKAQLIQYPEPLIIRVRSDLNLYRMNKV